MKSHSRGVNQGREVMVGSIAADPLLNLPQRVTNVVTFPSEPCHIGTGVKVHTMKQQAAAERP